MKALEKFTRLECMPQYYSDGDDSDYIVDIDFPFPLLKTQHP